MIKSTKRWRFEQDNSFHWELHLHLWSTVSFSLESSNATFYPHVHCSVQIWSGSFGKTHKNIKEKQRFSFPVLSNKKLVYICLCTSDASQAKMVRQILNDTNVKWVIMFCHHCLYLHVYFPLAHGYLSCPQKTLETRHVLVAADPPASGCVPSCEAAVRNSCYSLIPASLPVFLCLILWHERRWTTHPQQSQQI